MPGMAHAAQPHIQACMAGTVVRPVQPSTRLVHVVRLALPLQLLDRQVLGQGPAVQLLVGGHHVDALQVCLKK